GATSAALVLRNVQFSDQGTYSVRVQNNRGSLTSLPAVLSVIGGVLDQSPRDLSVICGDNATFSVHATGPAKFNYQWQFQNHDIPGATQNNLLLVNVDPSEAGPYSVRVTNIYYSTNIGANLTVTVQPPVVTTPRSATAVQGQQFTYALQ